jgi:hypothetical protein
MVCNHDWSYGDSAGAEHHTKWLIRKETRSTKMQLVWSTEQTAAETTDYVRCRGTDGVMARVRFDCFGYSRSRVAFGFLCALGVLPNQLSSNSDFALLPRPETFGHLHFYRTSSHTTTSTMAIQTSNATSLANPQPPDTLHVADLPQTHHIQTLPLDVLAEIFAHVR